ncbi:MAG: hypothetical protein ABUK20_14255, partial [Anaerolineales bacterium]
YLFFQVLCVLYVLCGEIVITTPKRGTYPFCAEANTNYKEFVRGCVPAALSIETMLFCILLLPGSSSSLASKACNRIWLVEGFWSWSGG